MERVNFDQLKEWNRKLTSMLEEPEDQRELGWQMMAGEHLEDFVKDWCGGKPVILFDGDREVLRYVIETFKNNPFKGNSENRAIITLSRILEDTK